MNELRNMMEKALQTKVYSEVESILLARIRENRLDSQCWTFLMELLLYQNHGTAAQKVYDRARLLSPRSTWISNVSQKLHTLEAGPKRPEIDELLAVKKVKVTAGIIVKNAERTMERCLRSLLDAVDEIVVVDTGSTDRTLEIVSSFSDVKIVHFVWCDDFAAARNAGLPHMTGDWVLWVDSDEYLHEEDRTIVREAVGLFDDIYPYRVLHVTKINYTRMKTEYFYDECRMFPLHRGLCYKGRVHEQIMDGNYPSPRSIEKTQTVRTGIRLHHEGYHSEYVDMKEKLRRNQRLLAMMVEEEPNHAGAWYFYGRETLFLGEIDQAIDALRKAEELERTHSTTLKHATYELLARAYYQKKDWRQAEEVYLRALADDPSSPTLLYRLALTRMNRAIELYGEAKQNLLEAKAAVATYRGPSTRDDDIANWKADLAFADAERLSGFIKN